MTDEFTQSLEYISDQLNRYVAPIIFIVGVVGNILNCLILSKRTLRSNSCALLFLISSFTSLISILIGLPTRILAGWHVDPTNTFDWACKTRVFIVFSTRTMSIWLITLATIDRWLLSSIDIHRRQMSNLKNIKRVIFIVVILSIVFYIHMICCYKANMNDEPLKCYGKSVECRIMTDLIYAIITIIIPLSLMIIFGLTIISNVHHIHTRVHTRTIISTVISSRTEELRIKKIDHHLVRMLLVQVLLLTIFCIPQAIQKFYITFKPHNLLSKQEDALNHFLYNIEVILAFIASGMPFYVYTISGGTVFRKASKDFMKEVYRKLTCQL
ncbi:unnamed protein product [Rotaria sordida]|uniref:G-protein coupled receptors family 1 profile domain-containing protein n=1 Tax=Rotaria sordida TaxID=392033 RepID=A0A813V2N8_9BILA|nr:unnamed protein product [Rotaria sordida]